MIFKIVQENFKNITFSSENAKENFQEYSDIQNI